MESLTLLEMGVGEVLKELSGRGGFGGRAVRGKRKKQVSRASSP